MALLVQCQVVRSSKGFGAVLALERSIAWFGFEFKLVFKLEVEASTSLVAWCILFDQWQQAANSMTDIIAQQVQ